VPDVLRVDYRYPARGQKPPVHLSWFSGCVGPDLAAAAAFHGFRNGVLFEGTGGKLLADYGRYVLLPEEKFRGLKPPTPSIPPSAGHHKEWLDAIRTGGPTTCNFDYSGALAETVLLGNVAFRSGAGFAWDEAAGRTDSAAANLYLRRQYRKGWEL
jgi:hypothetical protein